MALLRSKPLRQRSERQARREKNLSVIKRQLLSRARYRCESCGVTDEALEAHHTFGRSALGPYWSDHPAVVTVICRGCHHAATDNPANRDALRLDALLRLRSLLDDPPPLPDFDVSGLALVREAMQLTDLLGEPT